MNGQGETNPMFAITGITGKVGGEVAHNLLAGNRPVRPVVRDLVAVLRVSVPPW